MYQCLFEPEAIGLRIHVLADTMCPRFHVDRVPVRLLCTYRGPGTGASFTAAQRNAPPGRWAGLAFFLTINVML
jgi:hypothetical protein